MTAIRNFAWLQCSCCVQTKQFSRCKSSVINPAWWECESLILYFSLFLSLKIDRWPFCLNSRKYRWEVNCKDESCGFMVCSNNFCSCDTFNLCFKGKSCFFKNTNIFLMHSVKSFSIVAHYCTLVYNRIGLDPEVFCSARGWFICLWICIDVYFDRIHLWQQTFEKQLQLKSLLKAKEKSQIRSL